MNATKTIILAAVLVLGSSAVWAEPDTPVIIPDAALRAVVQEELGITDGRDPTEAEMATLTELFARGLGIVDITGLEYATNMITLFLDYNPISDISALSGMNDLYELFLSNNNLISDLSPLSGLTNLVILELRKNIISDISSLSGLTNLLRLTLDDNQINNISPLSGLTDLQHLILTRNQIIDISLISGMTELTLLRLGENQITDISPLTGLNNLTELQLSYNQISNISPLDGLTSLTDLGLTNNQISDVALLSGLTNLTFLFLGRNQISDISPLSGLTSLGHLTLENNQIDDISALSGLPNLYRLKLSKNGLSDISPISSLTNLTNLDFEKNLISDISPLVGLTNLTRLYLEKNLISDISPLVGLTSMTTLYLTKNPLSWESYCDSIPTIEGNGTIVDADPNPYNCSVPPEETPEGSSVPVTPEDNTNPGTSPVTLTFEDITESGGTSLVTSDLGPTPPSGFQLGDPATYYDITTTATYEGLIVICINYSEVSYGGPPELLRLYHYDSGSWVDCTTFVDTEIICGEVTSLSPFAILLPEAPVFQSITASPNVLWPPNHKMIPITVNWIVLDDLDTDPIVELKSITMNEGEETDTFDPSFDDTLGDGHTTDDIQIIDDVIYLRAERGGTGIGRVYTLTYKATDFDGNVGTETVTVTVPHEAP